MSPTVSINPHRRISPRPALALAVVATIAAGLAGCGTGRKTGTFDVQYRAEAPRERFKVFFMEDPEMRPDMTERERESRAGLVNLARAAEDELKARGYQVTRNIRARDIDAYIAFSYRTSGERGVTHQYTPGTNVVVKGRQYSTPGQYSSMPYAWEDQMITIEIYDWSEVVAVEFDLGRIRPAWRGRLEYRARGLDGLTRQEAEFMSLNLLADFPTPRMAGSGIRHDLLGLHERDQLLGGRSSSQETPATAVAQTSR